MARDLSERLTIRRQEFDEDGRPTGAYQTRAANVPARLYTATGDQVYTEDTLRLESRPSFQIRFREMDSTDLVQWEGKDYEIQAVVDLVPRRWLQIVCRASE